MSTPRLISITDPSQYDAMSNVSIPLSGTFSTDSYYTGNGLEHNYNKITFSVGYNGTRNNNFYIGDYLGNGTTVTFNCPVVINIARYNNVFLYKNVIFNDGLTIKYTSGLSPLPKFNIGLQPSDTKYNDNLNTNVTVNYNNSRLCSLNWYPINLISSGPQVINIYERSLLNIYVMFGLYGFNEEYVPAFVASSNNNVSINNINNSSNKTTYYYKQSMFDSVINYNINKTSNDIVNFIFTPNNYWNGSVLYNLYFKNITYTGSVQPWNDSTWSLVNGTKYKLPQNMKITVDGCTNLLFDFSLSPEVGFSQFNTNTMNLYLDSTTFDSTLSVRNTLITADNASQCFIVNTTNATQVGRLNLDNTVTMVQDSMNGYINIVKYTNVATNYYSSVVGNPLVNLPSGNYSLSFGTNSNLYGIDPNEYFFNYTFNLNNNDGEDDGIYNFGTLGNTFHISLNPANSSPIISIVNTIFNGGLNIDVNSEFITNNPETTADLKLIGCNLTSSPDNEGYAIYSQNDGGLISLQLNNSYNNDSSLNTLMVLKITDGQHFIHPSITAVTYTNVYLEALPSTTTYVFNASTEISSIYNLLIHLSDAGTYLMVVSGVSVLLKSEDDEVIVSASVGGENLSGLLSLDSSTNVLTLHNCNFYNCSADPVPLFITGPNMAIDSNCVWHMNYISGHTAPYGTYDAYDFGWDISSSASVLLYPSGTTNSYNFSINEFGNNNSWYRMPLIMVSHDVNDVPIYNINGIEKYSLDNTNYFIYFKGTNSSIFNNAEMSLNTSNGVTLDTSLRSDYTFTLTSSTIHSGDNNAALILVGNDGNVILSGTDSSDKSHLYAENGHCLIKSDNSRSVSIPTVNDSYTNGYNPKLYYKSYGVWEYDYSNSNYNFSLEYEYGIYLISEENHPIKLKNVANKLTIYADYTIMTTDTMYIIDSVFMSGLKLYLINNGEDVPEIDFVHVNVYINALSNIDLNGQGNVYFYNTYDEDDYGRNKYYLNNDLCEVFRINNNETGSNQLNVYFEEYNDIHANSHDYTYGIKAYTVGVLDTGNMAMGACNTNVYWPNLHSNSNNAPYSSAQAYIAYSFDPTNNNGFVELQRYDCSGERNRGMYLNDVGINGINYAIAFGQTDIATITATSTITVVQADLVNVTTNQILANVYNDYTNSYFGSFFNNQTSTTSITNSNRIIKKYVKFPSSCSSTYEYFLGSLQVTIGVTPDTGSLTSNGVVLNSFKYHINDNVSLPSFYAKKYYCNTQILTLNNSNSHVNRICVHMSKKTCFKVYVFPTPNNSYNIGSGTTFNSIQYNDINGDPLDNSDNYGNLYNTALLLQYSILDDIDIYDSYTEYFDNTNVSDVNYINSGCRETNFNVRLVWSSDYTLDQIMDKGAFSFVLSATSSFAKNLFTPTTSITGYTITLNTEPSTTQDSSIRSNMLIINNDETQYYKSPLVSIGGTDFSYGTVQLYSDNDDTQTGTVVKGSMLDSNVTYVTYSFNIYVKMLMDTYNSTTDHSILIEPDITYVTSSKYNFTYTKTISNSNFSIAHINGTNNCRITFPNNYFNALQITVSVQTNQRLDNYIFNNHEQLKFTLTEDIQLKTLANESDTPSEYQTNVNTYFYLPPVVMVGVHTTPITPSDITLLLTDDYENTVISYSSPTAYVTVMTIGVIPDNLYLYYSFDLLKLKGTDLNPSENPILSFTFEQDYEQDFTPNTLSSSTNLLANFNTQMANKINFNTPSSNESKYLTIPPGGFRAVGVFTFTSRGEDEPYYIIGSNSFIKIRPTIAYNPIKLTNFSNYVRDLDIDKIDYLKISYSSVAEEDKHKLIVNYGIGNFNNLHQTVLSASRYEQTPSSNDWYEGQTTYEGSNLTIYPSSRIYTIKINPILNSAPYNPDTGSGTDFSVDLLFVSRIHSEYSEPRSYDDMDTDTSYNSGGGYLNTRVVYPNDDTGLGLYYYTGLSGPAPYSFLFSPSNYNDSDHVKYFVLTSEFTLGSITDIDIYFKRRDTDTTSDYSNITGGDGTDNTDNKFKLLFSVNYGNIPQQTNLNIGNWNITSDDNGNLVFEYCLEVNPNGMPLNPSTYYLNPPEDLNTTGTLILTEQNFSEIDPDVLTHTKPHANSHANPHAAQDKARSKSPEPTEEQRQKYKRPKKN